MSEAWLSTDEMAANILAAYHGAPDSHRADGSTWYQRAHDEAVSYGLGLERGAALIAVLSPRNWWADNVRASRAAAAGQTERPSGILGTAWAKALRVMAADSVAEIEAVMAPPGTTPSKQSGPKVRAFYANIVNPDDGWHVTVDAHALALACGRPPKVKGAKKNLPIIDVQHKYDPVADAFRKAAATLAITPSTLQAIVWLAYAV